MESCLNCRFAWPAIGDDGEPYGRCRRFPPVLVVLDGTPVQTYPSVFEGEWCGEWQARSEATT